MYLKLPTRDHQLRNNYLQITGWKSLLPLKRQPEEVATSLPPSSNFITESQCFHYFETGPAGRRECTTLFRIRQETVGHALNFVPNFHFPFLHTD